LSQGLDSVITMARPLLTTAASLQACWVGDGMAVWGWEGRQASSSAVVRQMAVRTLGSWWLDAADARPLAVAMPDGQPAVAATAVVYRPSTVVDMLTERYPTAGWTPSLRWFHAVAELAAAAAGRGLVLPAVETAGLRWRTSWVPLADATLDRLVDQLEQAAPPVVWAAQSGAGASPSRAVFAALADAACRHALAGEGWRPDLGRSRSAVAVALRRVTTGLTGHPMVVGTTAAHEAAFAQWSAALADVRSQAEGSVPATFRGRLRPPDDADDPWLVEFEAVSVDDPSLYASWAEVWDGGPAAQALAGDTSLSPLRERIRTQAARLVSTVAPLAALGAATEPAAALLTVDDVGRLLGNHLDACARAGAPILVPSSLVRRTARLTASATPREGGGPSAGLGQALVEVDWGLALGDDQLTEAELATLANAKAGLVHVRGRWVQLDEEQMARALGAMTKHRQRDHTVTATDLLRIAAEGRAGEGDAAHTGAAVSSEGWLRQLLTGVFDDRLEEVSEPEGFAGTLRPYQRRGLSWLAFLGRLRVGGCLADDMGLGKTPTTLAHLAARRSVGVGLPHLVLCPLSVVHNWESEAARFTPLLRTMVVHGSDRRRGAELAAAIAGHDVVITTYGTATRDIDDLAAVSWDVVVCDEAQTIKNHHTHAARAVRRLDALQKIALTGTPVENRLAELWAILDAVNPGMLGGISWFRERFATPIEQHDDEHALAGLRQLTQPFLLRRTKADRALVPDLPDKVEQLAWATLTKEQASLYRAVLDAFLADADAETGMKRRGLVLATLTRLKQICNHPAQYLADGSRLGHRSGKLARFDELVDELLDAGERALVFTQYREMGELLVRHLAEARHLDVPFLHGGVAKGRRDAMVARFQAGEGPPLQLVSLKAGGTGLNLTAASRVIHYDRWWNPAVEDQATDRAWRIGQRSTVFVHKLVCQGTLEERIDALLADKQRLAGMAVGSGEAWLTELSTDALWDLLALGAEAVG
jgi:hypothetical protein